MDLEEVQGRCAEYGLSVFSDPCEFCRNINVDY